MKRMLRQALTTMVAVTVSLVMIQAPTAAADVPKSGIASTSQDEQGTDLDSLTAGVQRHLKISGDHYVFSVDSATAARESSLVIEAGQNFNAMKVEAHPDAPPRGLHSDSRMRPQLKIPVWGNWCGPGHSGPGAPVDTLDTLCMRHDKCYASRGYFDCYCDAQLKAEIDRFAHRMGDKERSMAAAVKLAFSVGLCNPF